MGNKCSIGSVLNSDCDNGKSRSYHKTEVDDLSLEETEFLRLRTNILHFDKVADICPIKFVSLMNFQMAFEAVLIH